MENKHGHNYDKSLFIKPNYEINNSKNIVYEAISDDGLKFCVLETQNKKGKNVYHTFVEKKRITNQVSKKNAIRYADDAKNIHNIRLKKGLKYDIYQGFWTNPNFPK